MKISGSAHEDSYFVSFCHGCHFISYFTVDNQNLIVQYGVLPVLHKTVTSSRRETRSAAMACLRNLSVHKANEVLLDFLTLLV